jgi:hypothetical protein
VSDEVVPFRAFGPWSQRYNDKITIQHCAVYLCLDLQFFSTIGEEFLGTSTPRVDASGTPQTHLHTRRSALARGVILQVIGGDIGQSANEYRRVVEGFRSLQVDPEL